MLRQRYITVFASFTLNDMQHLSVKIQVLKFDIPHFHTAQSATVDQADEQFVFQEFSTLKYSPDFFTA